MSFDTLKVGELKAIAEDFAVETEGLKNKQDIIAALSEEGVTYAVYAKTLKDVEDAKEEIEILPVFDPKAERTEDTVLVRMTRANFRYDILGHTFTQDHPFVAMHKDSAQEIFDIEEGFRLATPKEVQDYYG
jgi:alpha-ketoglutarate-dependent taurine dioxygenase